MTKMNLKGFDQLNTKNIIVTVKFTPVILEKQRSFFLFFLCLFGDYRSQMFVYKYLLLRLGWQQR